MPLYGFCVCLAVTRCMRVCVFVFIRVVACMCVELSRCSSGFRLELWWDCSLAPTCHSAFTRADMEGTGIPRFHARSSRSVFNLLTVKLISHPITQQLTPNWLLSFSLMVERAHGSTVGVLRCMYLVIMFSLKHRCVQSSRCAHVWFWVYRYKMTKKYICLCVPKSRIAEFGLRDNEMHT